MKPIVSVDVSKTIAPKPTNRDILAVVYRGERLCGVATSLVAASTIFVNCDPNLVNMVLCVSVPHARYCTCVEHARRFFESPADYTG